MKTMTVVKVNTDNADLYIEYARDNGRNHDESFLPSEDFLPDSNHPAFLLMDSSEVVGAAGLLLTEPYRNAGRGRITILHASPAAWDSYPMLTEALLTESGMNLYGFLPEDLKEAGKQWRRIGWKEERRAYLLVNDNPAIPNDETAHGFSWRFVTAADEKGLEIWRNLINRNFAQLAGHVELTLERVRELAGAPENLGEGLTLLLGPNGPVGTLQAEIDEEEPEGSFLGAICLNPEMRGRGLGRLLLRRGLALSRRAGLNPTWLSVNAENDNAVSLYLSENFRKEKVMICYGIAFPNESGQNSHL